MQPPFPPAPSQPPMSPISGQQPRQAPSRRLSRRQVLIGAGALGLVGLATGAVAVLRRSYLLPELAPQVTQQVSQTLRYVSVGRDADWWIYAFKPDTGAIVWRRKMAQNPPPLDLEAPVVAGETVIAHSITSSGSDEGPLMGLDPQTGAIKWQTTADAVVTISMYGSLGEFPAFAGDTVFIIDQTRHTLVALRAGDGHRLWSQDVGNLTLVGVTIDQNTLYVSTTANGLVAVRISDGVALWRFNPPNAQSPSGYDETVWQRQIGQGVVYTLITEGDTRSMLYALREADGSQLWARQLPGVVAPSNTIAGDSPFEIVDGIATLDDALYLQTENDQYVSGTLTINSYTLTALAISDGQPVWSYHNSEGITLLGSSPGAIYMMIGTIQQDPSAGALSSTILALRSGDGSLLWNQTLPDGIDNNEAIVVGDTLYLGKYVAQGTQNADGSFSYFAGVYALRGTDGAILWRTKIEESQLNPENSSSDFLSYLAFDEDNGTVYQCHAGVYAFRASDGELLWKLQDTQSPGSAPEQFGPIGIPS